ncbi:hypothetical protein BDB00DRAFT_812142 [Zychaea mexicana]|uniref:uncharacterized protein n=1 Tax=Zychaea mexicana TaxID=64656 RepID=UPI0022FE64D1|nr:uncharacterized protein BDB00DRAFT_812142 [Zychaea mexicana]KAI9495837.1 hypothetical protein BDB00DRAFT_812142 [Zychaea mexicana]
MRCLIFFALFAFVCLTHFTVAGQKSGGGSRSSRSGSTGRTNTSGSRGGRNSTSESSATAIYAAPSTQTYLNLQNILVAAGVMVLAQQHYGHFVPGN